jgi:hypothetical protein
VWSAVAGGGDCGLYAADVKRPGAPELRAWSACGTGCRESSAPSLATDSGVYRYALAAGVVGADAYLRVTSGSPGYRLMLVSELATGKIVAAAKQIKGLSACNAISSERAVRALAFVLPGGAVLVGVAAPATQTVTWSPPQTGVPLPTAVFANDAGWGMQFEDGSVRVLMSANATSLTTIDRSSLPTGQGQALLDRMLWSSAESGRDAEVVKGYVAGSAVGIVAAQDTDNHAIALSDSKAVWVGTTGPQRHQGTYQTAQLYWAAWPNGSANGGVTIHDGPALPATNALSSVATWGDYAATIGCTQGIETCELLVVQLSTGKLWRLHRRPTGVFLDVMAVTPTEILLSERGYPDGFNDQVLRFVRLELSQLDTLEHAW